MDFVDINGVALHYRLVGPKSGKPLVLVNSLGTDSRIWNGVIERLSGRYRILAYDKRGHGLSDAPPGPYRLDDHIEDLEALLDRLGIGDFALAGVSVGGMIGQAMGARHGSRILALVLCNTAAQIGTQDYWDERIATVRNGGMAAIADLVTQRWFSPSFRTRRPAELAGYRNMLLRADVAGYAATCAAIRDADLRPDLAGITVPTLVIGGEYDLAVPPELVEATAAMIKGARYELVADTGHIPFIEQPALLASMIGDFLAAAGYA